LDWWMDWPLAHAKSSQSSLVVSWQRILTQ
jgi:hypothetical protein